MARLGSGRPWEAIKPEYFRLKEQGHNQRKIAVMLNLPYGALASKAAKWAKQFRQQQEATLAEIVKAQANGTGTQALQAKSTLMDHADRFKAKGRQSFKPLAVLAPLLDGSVKIPSPESTQSPKPLASASQEADKDPMRVLIEPAFECYSKAMAGREISGPALSAAKVVLEKYGYLTPAAESQASKAYEKMNDEQLAERLRIGASWLLGQAVVMTAGMSGAVEQAKVETSPSQRQSDGDAETAMTGGDDEGVPPSDGVGLPVSRK